MRAFRFLGLASAALLCGATAGAQEAAPLTDPGVLFSTACAGGQARLPRNQFDDVAYAVMPAGARAAFASTLAKGAAAAPLGDLQVPNRVLTTLPDHDVYLLLPASGLPGAAAESCGVVWKGSAFDGALKVLQNLSGKPAPAAPAPGQALRYHASSGAGHTLVAVERDQWTALTIVPDATSKEQKTP